MLWSFLFGLLLAATQPEQMPRDVSAGTGHDIVRHGIAVTEVGQACVLRLGDREVGHCEGNGPLTGHFEVAADHPPGAHKLFCVNCRLVGDPGPNTTTTSPSSTPSSSTTTTDPPIVDSSTTDPSPTVSSTTEAIPSTTETAPLTEAKPAGFRRQPVGTNVIELATINVQPDPGTATKHPAAHDQRRLDNHRRAGRWAEPRLPHAA